MSKLKETFCYSTSKLGKLSEFLVKAVASAEITAYSETGDPYKTYCWCCALWRGILVGLLTGFGAGSLI